MYLASAQTCARIVGFCALVVIMGCGSVDLSEQTDPPEQVLSEIPTPPTGSSTPSAPQVNESNTTITTPPSSVLTQHTEAEPNNSWEQAETVAFGGNLEITGAITPGAKDVDIFDLGTVPAGRRVQANLTVNGGTDVQIGLFDGLGRILAYVDPISPTAGPGYVDIVLRETADPLLIMIATRSTSSATRGYSAKIQAHQNGTAIENPQVVVLVFQGASGVKIGSRPVVNVPAFDIAAVNPDFAGQTGAAIDLLLQKVREDYDGLGVDFYADSDPTIPAGEHTSVYFGTSDTRLLGLADNIDQFNGNLHQSAIIYTDTFSLFNQLHPGFDGTVQVLANVASHEAGHLLGLRHAADPEELMDVTATARQMLMDQWFKTSPLHSSVLPIGVQDAPTMLSWGLGGALKPVTTFKLYTRARAVAPGTPEQDFYIPRSMLADCGCVECDSGQNAPR